MLELREGTPLKMLQQFAVNLRADLLEDMGAARLVLDNENGKGSISLYEVFPGLTAWIYNINFAEKFQIKLQFSDAGVFYFGYHVYGYQMTKFSDEQELRKIGKRQNFILSGDSNTSSEFIIPANTRYECCYLIIEPDKLDEPSTKIKTQLKGHLDEIFSYAGNKRPYRYFSNIDIRTGVYTNALIKNSRTDLVGRLITEAAIMNMLASQLESHEVHMQEKASKPDISKLELIEIAKLGDYIQANLNEKHTLKELSHVMGLPEKKLQDGIRFLFGHSVNQYIINIRLERAMELFTESDMNVSQICYEIGYTSRSYFSKQFKERYGVLPSEYRNSLYMEDLFFEISYRSKGKEDESTAEIANILKTSRIKNKIHLVTGCLIYYRNVFFQLIEGPKNEVMKLYELIKQDARHTDVQLIWQGAKPERDFKDWDMALLSDVGILKIPHEDNTKELNLGPLMGEINEQSLESKRLWRKVRNVLKTKSSGSDDIVSD